MQENGKEKRELMGKMRRKRLKKYALTALALVIVVSVAVGFKLEDRDAKLPDGQGEIVVNTDQTGEGMGTQDGSGDANAVENADGSNADTQGQSGQTGKDKDGTAQSDTKGNARKPVKKYTEAEKKNLDAEDIKVDNKDDFTASNDGNRALKPDVPEDVTLTLEIRCDTLSSAMEKLENPAIEDYIPEDGIILKKTTYKGTTDNTVFDALNTLCRNNDIQLDFSYTPIYESYYIKGINYLYEFDGGPQSGWMYKVNDWFPNYGCSSYYLRDGDVIVWCYTCEGLGTDVGADAWMG